MNNTLVNRDFERAMKQLRRILPKLSFGLLIGTYLISALIMGIFHAQNAPHWGFVLAAYLVPLAIQAGRGTLVFFFQLNPARIQSRFSMGIIAATALLVLSLWEAYLVMSPHGLSWTVSVSTLMLIGWVIEIMILKETMFATQMALYQNKEQWRELHEFYVARNDFERFMDELYDGNKPALPIRTEASSRLEGGAPLRGPRGRGG
jgi:ABC-type nickel/cobalt efflux system permease component RcnA